VRPASRQDARIDDRRLPDVANAFAFTSMKTRPESPDRSSDGPGATPRRSVRRSHRTEPCRNWVALTGSPGGASTAVTARIAEKFDVTVIVYVSPASPRSQFAPTSRRTPLATGREAKADQETSPAWRSTSVVPRSSTD